MSRNAVDVKGRAVSRPAVARHEVYLTSSRYGAYAHCSCGWTSAGCGNRVGAQLAWAQHLVAVR